MLPAGQLIAYIKKQDAESKDIDMSEEVQGLGKVKADKYGEEILKILATLE